MWKLQINCDCNANSSRKKRERLGQLLHVTVIYRATPLLTNSRTGQGYRTAETYFFLVLEYKMMWLNYKINDILCDGLGDVSSIVYISIISTTVSKHSVCVCMCVRARVRVRAYVRVCY